MKKKTYDYLILTGIMLIIFSLVFVLKGVFPFGDNSIAYTDLKYQISAFFYHFWDSVRGADSLLITHNLGATSNFFIHMCYYIMSPFSLLVLLVSRVDIYKMISLIIVGKCILSSLTFMWLLKKLFNNLDKYSKFALSILYAISGYFLIFSPITAWLDMTYLLPLIIYGLKKMFDTGKGTFYYITLSISLILSFYTSALLLIYIFIISFIYLWIFKKEEIKSRITTLCINTGLALATSTCTLLPSYLGLSLTHRSEISIDSIFSAKVGPIFDKIHLVLLNGVLVLLTLLLIFQFKKYKKEVSFLVISLLLLFMPILIEPINKIVHLGSYYCFPCRYGFLIIMALALGSAFYLNNVKTKKILKVSILRIIELLGLVVVTTFIFLKKENVFEKALSRLNILKSSNAIIYVGIIFILIAVTTLLIKKRFPTRMQGIILLGVAILFSFLYSYTYIGLENEFANTRKDYQDMEKLNKLDIDKHYKIKIDDIDNGYNIGEFTGFPSDFSFSSLNTKTNLIAMQNFGYCYKAGFVNNYGGTLFTDILLGNKYLYTKHTVDESMYSKIDANLHEFNLYELSFDIPFGYILNNNVMFNDNIFQNQNNIYQSMTGKNNLFDVKELDKEETTTNIKVTDTKTLYIYIDRELELTSLINPYKSYNIYINDELYIRNVEKGYNVSSILYLGTFTDTNVKIDVINNEKTKSQNDKIYLGVMDNSALKELRPYDIGLAYEGSNTLINYEATSDEEGKILYIPISYLEGMTITQNGKEVEGIKVFGQYLGITLVNGENNIKVSYQVPGLKLGIIITIVSIIIFLVINKFIIKIIDIKWLNNICYYGYFVAVIIATLIIFVLPVFILMYKFIR